MSEYVLAKIKKTRGSEGVGFICEIQRSDVNGFI